MLHKYPWSVGVLLCFLIVFPCHSLLAQKISVKGVVKDAVTLETLEDVSIRLAGSDSILVRTSVNGTFCIDSVEVGAKLVFEVDGYFPDRRKVKQDQVNEQLEIKLGALTEEAIQFQAGGVDILKVSCYQDGNCWAAQYVLSIPARDGGRVIWTVKDYDQCAPWPGDYSNDVDTAMNENTVEEGAGKTGQAETEVVVERGRSRMITLGYGFPKRPFFKSYPNLTWNAYFGAGFLHTEDPGTPGTQGVVSNVLTQDGSTQTIFTLGGEFDYSIPNWGFDIHLSVSGLVALSKNEPVVNGAVFTGGRAELDRSRLFWVEYQIGISIPIGSLTGSD